MNQRSTGIWIAVLLVAATGGCKNVSMPRFMQPAGTASSQQARAAYEDPYADNVAGPEIVGGRPRDFQKQLAEPVRSNPYNLRGPGRP
ncbi:MAG: hypothetical protein U0795_11370 [Pirellulales bacterium]